MDFVFCTMSDQPPFQSAMECVGGDGLASQMLRGSGWTYPMVIFFWVNYNELTTSSLEIMVSKGNHPQMALIQVSEIL